MQRIQEGEREALEILYDRHASLVLGMLLKVVGNRTVAEELLQETFWRVWNRADTFDSSKGKFVSWMLSIARRQGLDTLRRWKSRPKLDEGEQSQLKVERILAQTNVAQDVSRNLQYQAVRTAMGTLPAEQRIIIELSYFKGKTRRQIAEELMLPLGTVHTRARAGLQKLRAFMIDHGWEDVA